jgi:hypothetical protein
MATRAMRPVVIKVTERALTPLAGTASGLEAPGQKVAQGILDGSIDAPVHLYARFRQELLGPSAHPASDQAVHAVIGQEFRQGTLLVERGLHKVTRLYLLVLYRDQQALS